MEEDNKNPSESEKESEKQVEKVVEEEETVSQSQPPSTTATGGGGGGWGGWGFSPYSVLSDLQKAAAVAAEEISRNAVEVAKTAAKSIAEIQSAADDPESSTEEEESKELIITEKTDDGGDDDDDDDANKLRRLALDKLEKASEDSLLGQGLKVLDNSVENFASGAWQAFGNAWKGGSNFVQKLEHSAANIAESVQQGGVPGSAGSVAPSILETGIALSAKGIQVLEKVGKETMDLLIAETGIVVEKDSEEVEQEEDNEDQSFEEVNFDRCFYIYGGPEQLEELEALSNHYAMLFNRRKAKLSSEQKSVFNGKLKQVQQIFNMSIDIDGLKAESDKGKKVETGAAGRDDEMKRLHDSSVSKAADMAAGFTSALSGLAANDIIQRTAGRIESLHSEGVHRLSEMCCFAVSQLLMLGKSLVSNANKAENEDTDGDEDVIKMEWPEDSIEKANIIRMKAQSMTGSVEAVSSSFITGICDVAEIYQAAMKSATADSQEVLLKTSIQEKSSAFTEHLQADQITALSKIQDGLQYLCFVVLSTSMPAA